VKRLAGTLVLLLAGGLLAGCTGADAKRAEALLQQAQLAQRHVRSEAFVLKLGVDAGGHSGSFDLQGGEYLHGPHAGDFFVQMEGAGFPGSSAVDVAIERRGTEMTVRAAGRTETLSAPAARARLGSGFGDPARFVDVAQYVKSVSVDKSDLNGRPADRIVGTIDLQRLLGSLGGLGSTALGSTGVNIGDARVVLFVPRDTHLVEVMLVDTTISGQGHTVHLHLSFALNGINRPLSFP
jgi:hypothetical protein